MRKIAFLLTVVICLTMTGCVPHTELNEKAIVELLAIDFKDGIYEVNIQYYNLSGSGSNTQIDASKPNVLTAKGTGINVYSALTNVELNCGRELMLGINQAIIIGRDVLDQNLAEILDFARTYNQSHPRVLICIANEKASDITDIKFVEGAVSTQKLKFLFNNSDKLGIVSFPTLTQVFINLSNRNSAMILPLLMVEDSKSDASEDGKEIKIAGGILLRNGKYYSDVDRYTTSGIQLLDGKVSETSVNIEFKEETLSLELFDVYTDLETDVVDGNLVVKVNVIASARFMDVIYTGISPEEDDEIGRLAAAQLINRMETAREYVVNGCSADILQLEVKLRHSNYTRWLKNEENFTELLSTAKFDYEVEVVVDRYGLEQ